MSFHQALDLIFKLNETTVGCIRDILRKTDFLDRFSKVSWVIPTFVVIEGEVLYKINMVIKDLDLEPKIDIMMMDFLNPSQWKELSKEMGSEILPSGDGSREETFKPISRLIAKEKLK
nr:hypothetical protein [Tanacetum cinerariifolium]